MVSEICPEQSLFFSFSFSFLPGSKYIINTQNHQCDIILPSISWWEFAAFGNFKLTYIYMYTHTHTHTRTPTQCVCSSSNAMGKKILGTKSVFMSTNYIFWLPFHCMSRNMCPVFYIYINNIRTYMKSHSFNCIMHVQKMWFICWQGYKLALQMCWFLFHYMENSWVF